MNELSVSARCVCACVCVFNVLPKSDPGKSLILQRKFSAALYSSGSHKSRSAVYSPPPRLEGEAKRKKEHNMAIDALQQIDVSLNEKKFIPPLVANAS